MTIGSTRDARHATSTQRADIAPKKTPPPPPEPVSKPTKQAHVGDAFSDSRVGDLKDLAAGIKLDDGKAEKPKLGFSSESDFKPSLDVSPDSVSGGIKGGVEGGYKSKSGWGISGGVSAEVKGSLSVGTEDGMRTTKVSVELSRSASGSITAPVGSVSGSITAGQAASYSVSLPEESTVDPTSINPYEPSTMPTGAVVKLDETEFTETELGASFKALSLDSGVKEGDTSSLVIEKTGDTTVRVTVGDTDTIEAKARLGVGMAGVSVGLGKTDDIKSGTMSTVELDLATPEGRAAYDAILSDGTLPKEGVTRTEFFDMTSSSAVDVKVGGKSLVDLSLGSNSGTYTRTTAPDGTITGKADIQYEGGAALHVEQTFNPDGTERMDERTYTFDFTVSGPTEQGELSIALKQDLEIGQRVSVTMTEAQMAELHASGADARHPVAEATLDPERFAVALAAADDGMLENLLFRLADPTGSARSFEELKALPMQVIIRP